MDHVGDFILTCIVTDNPGDGGPWLMYVDNIKVFDGFGYDSEKMDGCCYFVTHSEGVGEVSKIVHTKSFHVNRRVFTNIQSFRATICGINCDPVPPECEFLGEGVDGSYHSSRIIAGDE